jgi:hypothetical protein
MQTRKAVLPFYIASCENGNINSEHAASSQNRINIMKVSLRIKHYMWLDSDVLIVLDISEMYSKCCIILKFWSKIFAEDYASV